MLAYDQDLYDLLYSGTLPDGRTVRYGREYVNLEDPPHWTRQYETLMRLGLGQRLWGLPQATVLIVGCGFSPLLTAFGLVRTIGTDPSPYIQEHKHTESDTPEAILPYSVPDSRLSEALKGRVALVITDDVLSSLKADCIVGRPRETEAERFIDGCSELGDLIVHFVTTGRPDIPNFGHPMFTYRTLAEWQKYEPRHIWIDANTFEVAHG